MAQHRIVPPRLGFVAAQRDLQAHVIVVLTGRLEDRDNRRNQQQHDPGALERCGDRHDDEHDAGHHRAEAVDERAGFPPRFPAGAPVDNHAGLRPGERHEHADHVQRQKQLSVAAERDDEDRCEDRQDDDAVRERGAIALVHELAGAGSDRARRWRLGAGSPRQRLVPHLGWQGFDERRDAAGQVAPQPGQDEHEGADHEK